MNGRKAGADGNVPRPLATFLWTIVALTLICVVVEAFSSTVLHLRYPYDWPFMPTNDIYRDFKLYQGRFAYFHSPLFFSFGGEQFLYPAPAAAVYALFFRSSSPIEIFLISLCATALGALCVFGFKLASLGLSFDRVMLVLVTLALCAYPFFFDFEQANVEWVIAALVACGIWAFWRGRGYSAAACFGLAASIKFYPIVFAGLHFARRQYREAAAAVGVAVLSTVVGLWLLCPHLALSWNGTMAGLTQFRTFYVLGHSELGFDHSLFALYKQVWLVFVPSLPESLPRILSLYTLLSAMAGVLLYFSVIRKLPLVNQVICLAAAITLLPPVSYDYTLLHLYAPWTLLAGLAVKTRGRHVPGMTAALVCFAILMAPETELILDGHSWGGQVKALALMALFGIALRFRFDSNQGNITVPDASLQPLP